MKSQKKCSVMEKLFYISYYYFIIYTGNGRQLYNLINVLIE